MSTQPDSEDDAATATIGPKGGIERPSPARSALMSRIRQKDTAPEVAVRRLAHRLGLRFRIHRKDLPGTPDVVFPGRRVVVFVHGCFWHGHEGCRRAKAPSTNVEFWAAKIARNRARDEAAICALRASGWRVEVVWACEAKTEAQILARLHAVFPDTVLST